MVAGVDQADVKLTAAEARFIRGWLILSSVGGIPMLIIGNTTGNWFPAFAFVALLILTYVVFSIRVARLRDLSVRSVLARGLPDRARRSSRDT
jgi:hypothetical protein